MNIFSISFGDSTVSVAFDTPRALDYLSFLFSDISGSGDADMPARVLALRSRPETDDYELIDDGRTIHRGKLDVRFAAHLYDLVIYHLLNETDSGIALHAGAVVHDGRIVILPGVSGSGKSSLTAWLVAQGCSYLSDELIFISNHSQEQVFYFSRPICLKPGSVPLFAPLSETLPSQTILKDDAGAVLPHRIVNPKFKQRSAPPDVILFPDYQADLEPHLEPISTARATTLLMGCHVNARNLEQHGFKQMIKFAGKTTAFRLRYRSFQDAEACLADIFAW